MKNSAFSVKITPCTSEFLEPKIEKSPTHSDFENFDFTPKLTSNFDTHSRNVGDIFLIPIEDLRNYPAI